MNNYLTWLIPILKPITWTNRLEITKCRLVADE